MMKILLVHGQHDRKTDLSTGEYISPMRKPFIFRHTHTVPKERAHRSTQTRACTRMHNIYNWYKYLCNGSFAHARTLILPFNTISLPSTVQYSTVQHSTVQYTTLHYTTLHYSTVHYTTEQCSAVQHNTVQYIILQNSTIHYSTPQHSTVKFSTIQSSKVQTVPVL